MEPACESVMWAIKNGDLDQVKDLCDKQNFDVNHEITSRFPVHYAADYGQADVLAYLLSKGANANAVDKHGITPILAAIWEGHTNCVKILLDAGVPKTGKTPDGVDYIEAADKADIKALLSA